MSLALAALSLASCDFYFVSRGVVLGPDGAPVEGATVSMRKSCEAKKASRSTVTGPDGSYAIGYVSSIPGHRTVGIEVSKEGFERQCALRTVGSGAPVDPVRVELRPARTHTR